MESGRQKLGRTGLRRTGWFLSAFFRHCPINSLVSFSVGGFAQRGGQGFSSGEA